MKTHLSSRILSFVLAFALLIGLVPALGNLFVMPAGAVNIVKPLGENMFLQGNFEGIDLRDWSTNVSGVSVLNQLSADAEHSDGTRGLKIVTGTNTSGLRATVYGLTAGATYRLGIWAKAGTADAASVKVNLHQWTSAWGSDVKSSTVLTSAITNEWALYTCEFTMQVNRTIIQFDLMSTAGTVLADDLTVVRIADVPSAYLAPASTESYVLGADLGSAPRTFEGWIEVNGSQSGAIIGNYTGTLSAENAYGASYAVQYRDKKLELWWWAGSGQGPQIRLPFKALALPTNEKFHFAIVSDDAAGTVTCYINGGTANGGSQQTLTVADYKASDLYSWGGAAFSNTFAQVKTETITHAIGATRPLRIGGNSTSTNLAGTKIYSLAMFDSARTEKDIVLDMVRVPYESADLAAAYDFTAYGNERLEDHSANNNHLVYSDGTNTENYDVSGMSFDANVTWATTETLTAIPTTYTASVNLPADLNDYIAGGIIIGNVGNRAASNNSVFSFEVAAMGQPRVYWNSKLNGKTNLLFDEIDLRTGVWTTVTATIDTAASTVTVTAGEQSQTLSFTKALPPFDPYTASDSKGEYQQETGWMPLTIGGDTVDGNVNYFRGKIASVSATYADGNEALSYTLTDTDADGLVANQLWIREVEEPTDYEYSMVTVGDTQIINWYYPEAFGPIYDYIAAQATAANGKMSMVMGLGDITEMGTAEEEMQRANEHVSKLDGLVEYSMIRGNHDSPAYLEKYFGYARYKDKLGGSWDGSALNTWRTFVAGGVDYLLLTLEYYPKDATLEWAADVVASHPNHTVIVNTHAFLDYKGDLLTNRSINSFTTGPAGDPDTSMWDILISKYDNIQLVLCGHISNQGVTQTVFPREGLSDVTAMLIDPQGMDASIGATGMINTFYFGAEKADGTVDIDVVTYSTARGEYYGTDSQFTTSIKLAPKATATDSGNITLSGDFTVNNSNNVTSVTMPYTGTTTAPAGTRFAGQVTDLTDNSVLNAELVINEDGTATVKYPTSVAPEKLLVKAGTVFTSFDNTLTVTVTADYNATLLSWVELTPDNFHIWAGGGAADQENRCFVYFYSEDLNYDPGTSKWENFSPQNLPILIDGETHNALVIGETPNTTADPYPVAIIYLYESTVGIDGILANSDEIVIPQGTELKSPDGKTGIRFTKAVGLHKVNGSWSVYDPSLAPFEVEVTFTGATVNDNGTMYLPVVTGDGSAIMDTYGDWTTAFGSVWVDDVEKTNVGYSITNNTFYFGGLDMNNVSKIEFKAGTVLTPADECLSKKPIEITNDLVLVKTAGVWAEYDPTAPVLEDHTPIGPNLPDGKTNLVTFGSFNAASGFNINGNGAVENGMLRMDMTGADDMAWFQLPVTAGKTYRMSVYMWVTADGDIRIDGEASGHMTAYQNHIYSASNAIEGSSLYAATDGWVEMVYEFTAETTATANIYFVRNYYGGSTTVYLDDLCIYDVNEEDVSYTDIDFDVETDIVTSVAYNSNNHRTYLVFQSAATLPVTDWSAYSGTTTGKIIVDGVEHTVTFYAAGMDNANQVQLYVGNNNQTDFTTADEIFIPAGSVFTFGKKNLRFTKDFHLMNFGGWQKYDASKIPSDHTATVGPNLPLGHTNLVNFGSFDATTGFNIAGNGAVENGMLRMDITSTDDYAFFSRAVETGKTYRLSVYMWITDYYNIRIDGEASNNKSTYQNYIYSNANEIAGESLKAATGGWVEMVYEFTAEKTGTAHFYFVKNYWGGNATVYLDDLCFYDVNDIQKQTISIQKFSWAHSNIVGVNMGNYDELSATAWWSNYGGSNPYFYANGEVYLDGAETPTSVRIALPAGTNNNIFFYGMPADDVAVTIRIPEGAEFTSEAGEVILVFDKEYVIEKTAKNAATVAENSTKFAEYNVTLSSDMKVGVRVDPANGVSLADLTLTYTVAGGAAQTAELIDGLFYCNVPAKDMTSELVLTLQNANSQVQTSAIATTTLRAYALKLLTGEQTEAVKSTAKAMLNYGAMAQNYFGYNTGSLANGDYAYTQDQLDAADPGEVSGVHADTDTQPEAYAGASLLLQSKVGIRLYFKENVGGNLTYSESRDLYYYEFAGIGAGQLATEQSVTIDGVTYTVSVLSMARQVIDGDKYSDAFKNLMKAITLYADAASKL